MAKMKMLVVVVVWVVAVPVAGALILRRTASNDPKVASRFWCLADSIALAVVVP